MKENLKTIFYALIIALIIRSLFFQPFYIPSSSMEPNLLVGDRIFVTKMTYGYSRHSFPFSLGFSNKRLFFSEPERGDVVVFKTPADNRTDYIKRVIGMPGDLIQFIDGDLYINNNQVLKTKIKNKSFEIFCGDAAISVTAYEEKLPNGKSYIAVYRNDGSFKNSDKYFVPNNHYFFLGDNRDCSKDSRFLTNVGYVHKTNLVGKARIIFFSNNNKSKSLLNFWKLPKTIRLDRFFNTIK